MKTPGHLKMILIVVNVGHEEDFPLSDTTDHQGRY